MSSDFVQQLQQALNKLYPAEQHARLIEGIRGLLEKWQRTAGQLAQPIDEKTVYLIAYGDSLHQEEQKPLVVLKQFADRWLQGLVSDIHLLPMFPWTSDDGFSVVDYRRINPDLGDWSDIRALNQHFDLMFDCVINHVSSASVWFQGYLKGDEKYQNYFIEADPQADYHYVMRPRALPLLTPYVKADQQRVYVWTTFSEDQIDINFREPAVLLESIDVLLQYATTGGRSIRLDAIGFIWKAAGTPCIHLPEVHQIIKLWRLILDRANTGCRLITETNVPHNENIRYFGNGDEAHMVYQFPLPPLTLHAFLRQDSRWLNAWATQLSSEVHPPNTTFFNFLASHDGIGLRPTENLLDDTERAFLVTEVERRKGRISWRSNADGSKSPYELNINYLDAITDPDDDIATKADKFLAAQSILLAFRGVPALYYHSLLGSENDLAGVERSGINRRINREKLALKPLESALLTPGTLRAEVFHRLRHLIYCRRTQPAFSPQATQRVLKLGDALFGIERSDARSGERISCVVNISSHAQRLQLPLPGIELITLTAFDGTLVLRPWQAVWIKHEGG
ncbi:sugar phosphorylase [Gibbsiella quercinecans]|uniref:sugar phosphorylase n=1 Tax=Gibbsiella quercinecans TaxID=929813 RepID=UPI003A4D8E1B